MNWKRRKIHALVLVMGTLFFHSCLIQKRLGDDQIYLENHKIEFEEQKNALIPLTDVSADELLTFAKVKPNRKVLGFRFNMRVNTLVPVKSLARAEARIAKRCNRKNTRIIEKNKTRKASRQLEMKSCNGFWPWLAYVVGEPPVLLDSHMVVKSGLQMQIYLQKNGYFNAKVYPEIKYNAASFLWKEHKKCDVIYHVHLHDLFKIDTIQWDTQDANLLNYFPELKKSSLLKAGSAFHVDQLGAERERIAGYLNNNGYYEFIPDYIVFDVDTVTTPKHASVKLHFLNQKAIDGYGNFTGATLPHKRYYLGDITINTSYNPLSPNDAPKDTLKFEDLSILSNGLPCLKPDLLDYRLEIKEGQIYQRNLVDETYKRYSQLGVFKTVNVQLAPKTVSPGGPALLDVKILLAPNKRQTVGFDPRVINRAGNMGVYGNFYYKHRNVFRGAEALDFKLIVGAEASQVLGTSASTNAGDQIVQRTFQLNTFEIGPEVSLNIPRLWPRNLDKTSKSNFPKSSLRAAVNYQRRPDYTRTLSQVSFGWSFVENPSKVSNMDIEWAEISIIKISKSEGFQSWLDALNDSYLANSYIDHLICASRIGYTLNTQKDSKQSHSWYYRANMIEAAGNILRGVFNSLPNQSLDQFGSYRINNIRFAQYVKTDHDLRYYTMTNDRNRFALRGFVGVGIPLKNSSALPFEKSYFSGGANGIRAWQARTLGPGSYRDSTRVRSFNNIGDLKLEFNAEYRFKITQIFQGAFFVDAGNIWLVNKDASRPGSDFDITRFYRELAIGTGLGARLDFDFFIVRMDVGLPLRDPLKIAGERWAWQPKTEYNQFLQHVSSASAHYKLEPVVNLGIGFPF